MIHVVDSIMGSGKTQAAINFINASDKNSRFLYITPYLTEVKRIEQNCGFKQPKIFGTKVNGIKTLFKKGENIVTTHALFSKFDEEILEICRAMNYTLIMDEVAEVVQPLVMIDGNINKQDVKVLLENYVTVNNKGVLSWRKDQQDYKNGKYSDIKNLCNLKSLAIYNNNDILVWLFPVKIFKSFAESYILTYMFDGQIQKYYYDFHNLKYDYLYVKGDSLDNYAFTNEKPKNNFNYKELINICNYKNINAIGKDYHALSYSWYSKHNDDILFKQLKKNTSSFFRYLMKAKSNDIVWTTFKDYKNYMSGKGYTKGFVTHNMRAINEYRDRHNVAYLINKFYNPVIINFFKSYNIKTNEDAYSLSEMLQFIWRSAIRQGEPINIYIPSKRMRKLLEDWMTKQNY